MVLNEPAPSVVLLGEEPQISNLRYAIRYYTLSFLDRASVDSTVLTRLWYALSRQGVAMSVDPRFQNDHVDSLKSHSAPKLLNAWPPAALASAGARRMFGPGESIPPGVSGFLLNGTVREELTLEETDAAAQLATLLRQPPHPETKALLSPEILSSISTDAARFLGPSARAITERYARSTDDPYFVFHALAHSISAPADREQFLSGAPARPSRRLTSGAPFGWAGFLGLEPLAKRHRFASETATLLIFDRSALAELLKTLDANAFVLMIASEPGLRPVEPPVLAEALRAVTA